MVINRTSAAPRGTVLSPMLRSACLIAIAILLSTCYVPPPPPTSAPTEAPTGTPESPTLDQKTALAPDEVLQQAETLAGQRLTLQATLTQLHLRCADEECSESTPCCRGCASDIGVEIEVGEITLTGLDLGCSGDNCDLTCQPSPLGETYLVTGVLSGERPFLTLDVEALRLLDE